jgi:hypothetical protein
VGFVAALPVALGRALPLHAVPSHAGAAFVAFAGLDAN